MWAPGCPAWGNRSVGAPTTTDLLHLHRRCHRSRHVRIRDGCGDVLRAIGCGHDQGQPQSRPEFAAGRVVATFRRARRRAPGRRLCLRQRRRRAGRGACPRMQPVDLRGQHQRHRGRQHLRGQRLGRGGPRGDHRGECLGHRRRRGRDLPRRLPCSAPIPTSRALPPTPTSRTTPSRGNLTGSQPPVVLARRPPQPGGRQRQHQQQHVGRSGRRRDPQQLGVPQHGVPQQLARGAVWGLGGSPRTWWEARPSVSAPTRSRSSLSTGLR